MNNLTSTEELLLEINKGEALKRLLQHPDFELVFIKGLLEDELVKASYDFTSSNDDVVKMATKAVTSITYVREYLEKLSNIADNARNELGER